ncbi:MAG: hypothetical protein K0S36_2262 [Nitrosospira multiformis]|nr:hypothetical protein [Nitrosospira multiformis]
MSKSVNSDERQMNLDFNSAQVRVENVALNESKVVSLNAFAQSRQTQMQSPPVLDRLLQEAQKLRW